jgi:hypothetical protein
MRANKKCQIFGLKVISCEKVISCTTVIEHLNENIEGCSVVLDFNLDEVCISDCEDDKTRKVTVPALTHDQTMHHRISRNAKHIPVIVCVSTAEKSFIPEIFTSHDSAPVGRPLKKQGVPFGMGLLVKSKAKPYINA